jgi:hypothetical protein
VEPADWKDEDIIAVRKVFALLGREPIAAKGFLQIIVLGPEPKQSLQSSGVRGVKV